MSTLNNVVFLFISCKKNYNRHKFIEMMCYQLNIANYYFVVGCDSKSSIKSKYMYIQCNDHYEGLPEKCIKTFKFVYECNLHLQFKHFVKIDDDISIYDTICLQNLPDHDYMGFQYLNSKIMDSRWHKNKCFDQSYNKRNFNFINYLMKKRLPVVEDLSYFNGGAIYIFNKNALKCLYEFEENVYDYMYEDVIIAYILRMGGIFPTLISNEFKHGSQLAIKNYKNGYYYNNELQFLMDCDIRKENCIKFKHCNTNVPIWNEKLKRTFFEPRSAGLNDRKSLLTTMFIKCKNEKKVLLLTKFNLSVIHQRKNLNVKKCIETFLIEEYIETQFEVPYIFENSDDYNIILKNTPKQIEYDYFHDFNSEFILNNLKNIFISNQTMYTPTENVMKYGTEQMKVMTTYNYNNSINDCNSNNKKTLSVHLRKTDRLSDSENNYLCFQNIFQIIQDSFDMEQYVIYFATDDVELLNEIHKKRHNLDFRVFTHYDFEFLKNIDNNYLLFVYEMCIVESADIQVKTFEDSEFLYNMNTPGDFYYLLYRSMHEVPTDKSNFFFENKIYKQSVESSTKINNDDLKEKMIRVFEEQSMELKRTQDIQKARDEKLLAEQKEKILAEAKKVQDEEQLRIYQRERISTLERAIEQKDDLLKTKEELITTQAKEINEMQQFIISFKSQIDSFLRT